MLKTGDLLHDRYRIDTLLGEGGMGTVYKAFDTQKNQFLAVKELRLAIAPVDEEVTNHEDSTLQHNSHPVTRDQALKQFRKEADVLIGLSHDNLPKIEEYFDIADRGYFVMTLIEGSNLAEVVEEKDGAIPEETVRVWLKQLISALAHCHANGVIHRDVKPENLILTPEGKIYLVDFGISKTLVERESSHTTIGARAFTEHYSPPEQRPGGHGTDERTDIFALGAVLYFLLTGEAPEDVQMISAGATVKWPSSINPQISPEMDNLIMRCLRLDKRERPQSLANVEALLASKSFGKMAEKDATNREFDQDRLLQAVLNPVRPPSIPVTQGQPLLPSAPPTPDLQEQAVLTPEDRSRMGTAPLKAPLPQAQPVIPSTPQLPLSVPPIPVYPVRHSTRKPETPVNPTPAVAAPQMNHPIRHRSRSWIWMAAGGLLILVIAGALLGVGILNQGKSPRAALRQLQASSDIYSVTETYALLKDTSQGLLANDRNVDMAILSVALGTGPAHGLLKLNNDGSFTYVPESGFNGTDTFTYQFVPRTSQDATLRSEPIMVTVSVIPLFRIWMPVIGK
jgi:serine/threonine protein kinase